MTSARTQPLRGAAATVHACLPPDRSEETEPPLDSEDALRALYRDHAAALLAFAEWFTADRSAAEDAVQETFLRAWRHLPQLRADGRPPRPWLRQVLRRVLIDAARVAHARPVSLLDDVLIDRQVDGGYEDLLDRRLLDRALDQLSPAHRQVLVAIYFDDAPAQRVAATLGIPPATVRSRLHYALRALRRLLTERADLQTAR
ncbi:MAG TPA: sigma-70 family RNA polymerase sigma factor [Pseudonocardia sp.]